MHARSAHPLALALAVVSVALGCTGIRLDKVPVARLSASIPQESRLVPGGSSPLVVVATTTDGRELVTKGAGNGKVAWDSFDVEAHIVEVTRKGVVRVPADPRKTDGKVAHVRIRAKGHPAIVAELDVPVRYDGAFKADFSGRSGHAGDSGSNGHDGTAGSSATSSFEGEAASGGDGTDGSDGGDGGSGAAGEPGHDLHVSIALKGDEPPLLQVAVVGDDREELFLVDPRGGSLLVSADGGAGGPGGSGGRGGRGGSGGLGGNGGFSGRSGSDGRGGNDGSSGSSGKGGGITVAVDPNAMPFLSVVRFSNRDGNGKAGRPPEIREEPVAALW